jgi:predicted PurR-regulated permease PerM
VPIPEPPAQEPPAPAVGGAVPPPQPQRARAVRVLHIELDPRSILLLGVGSVVLWELLAVARTVQGALSAVATGLILALGLDPVVTGIRQRLRCGRTTAVALVSVVAAVFLVVLVLFVAPRAVRQAEQFGRELPVTLRQLYELPVIGGELQARDVATKVERWVDELPARLNTDNLAELTRAALNGITSLFTVALVAIAVLLDGEGVVRRARRLLPLDQRNRADRLGRTAYSIIARYFAGSLLVAVLAGLYTLAVGLALGVPLAPLAALWVTLTNLIPQIGGFLGGAFFTLLAMSQGLGTGLAALALFLLWLNVENHLIQPSIVGQAVDLSPPVTILAVLVGGAAAGVPGALIATPLVGTLKGLYFELRGITPTRRGSERPGGVSRLARRLLHGRHGRSAREPDEAAPSAGELPAQRDGEEPVTGSQASRGTSRQSRSSS